MKFIIILLFIMGIYCLHIFSNNTNEPELLVLSMISFLGCFLIGIDEIGRSLKLTSKQKSG